MHTQLTNMIKIEYNIVYPMIGYIGRKTFNDSDINNSISFIDNIKQRIVMNEYIFSVVKDGNIAVYDYTFTDKGKLFDAMREAIEQGYSLSVIIKLNEIK